jgi:hypothetical protein
MAAPDPLDQSGDRKTLGLGIPFRDRRGPGGGVLAACSIISKSKPCTRWSGRPSADWPLTFATRFAERVRNVILIASGFKTTVLNRLILFEQILAIENDPHFNGGNYYDAEAPLYGLVSPG